MVADREHIILRIAKPMLMKQLINKVVFKKTCSVSAQTTLTVYYLTLTA